MKLNDHIKLWNHASVKVLDIRSCRLEAGTELPLYQLPASAFVYAYQGHARVQMDDLQVTLRQNQIVHGGRGAVLQILAEESFEYWLVLYKAVLMLPSSKKLLQQLEREDPFKYQYSFDPPYPVPLLNKLEQMYEDWMTFDPLHSLHARTLFYQFIYELLGQMQRQGIEPVKPDLLVQALRYMQDHYMEPITLDTLAELFDCSVSYLSKLFKNRMNGSPIRVLTEIRMEVAANYLLNRNPPLQELAERVGYPDAHTFSRNFKKHYGLPPAQFKLQFRGHGPVPKSPDFHPKSALAGDNSRCYSIISNENYYHLRKLGGLPVKRGTKPASIATAALLLCFTLLISACSTVSNTANNSTGTNNSLPVSATNQEAGTAKESSNTGNAAAATKTYMDSKGEVTIPMNPERIIDLTGSAIGNLLVLDVKPIAAADGSLKNPFHEGRLEHIINVGAEPNAEAILELDPDLIITFDYIEESQYEQLAQIAPVVRLKYGSGTPQDLLLEFGKITRKEAAAQQWIEEWNAKIAEVKPEITKVVGDKTVSILQPYAKGIYAWGDKGGRGGEILYGDLELKAPDIIQKTLIDGEEFGGDLSIELLPEYAGDYIFTSNWGWDDGDANVVYGSKVWKSLPALKNNQVFFIDEKGSYYNDPISLDAQLKFIVESFLGTGK
ncbi:AraC family transcriptional regulator [Paenibacillus albidus]|uniref:ABC transporter substrate-binding protein n=1 Tax=Paenibacillus albidus TaxID=2041023 RepID=UPI001BEB8C10|nr:AraC family transcriptional regulator [Paenibacillus albidus]MBT2289547.1 AraC family transcriptional regulator [Paenibacillus albidus]